jgi:hypothetical protein
LKNSCAGSNRHDFKNILSERCDVRLLARNIVSIEVFENRKVLILWVGLRE